MREILPYALVWQLCAAAALESHAYAFAWSPRTAGLVAFSGVLSFFLNWSSFLVLSVNSALSHILLGQTKTCTLVLGSFALAALGDDIMNVPSTRSLVGSVVVVLLVGTYTLCNLQEKNRARAKALKDYV
jgi:solute carrier family 35 protein E3